jgi:hypothetical protein
VSSVNRFERAEEKMSSTVGVEGTGAETREGNMATDGALGDGYCEFDRGWGWVAVPLTLP